MVPFVLASHHLILLFLILGASLWGAHCDKKETEDALKILRRNSVWTHSRERNDCGRAPTGPTAQES
eukprot:1358849-Amphidinium_carterae.1